MAALEVPFCHAQIMDEAPSDVSPVALLASISPFSRIADRLIAGGYSPIPLMPREKVPGQWQGSLENGRWTLMDSWNDYSKNAPSAASIRRWKTWPGANIGVVLGTVSGSYQLVALDFDTSDLDELDKLQSQVPVSPMTKKGNRGYTAFYRADMSVKTKRYMVPDSTPEKPTKKRTVLEILTGNAPRQTVMPPSVHPSGMAYEFLTGGEIVPISQLPVLTEAHFEQLEDTLESIGWTGQVQHVHANDNTDDDDPTIWRETNNIALQKMHLWVGELGLPKLKRHPNGSWEAVPTWRPSNEGNPTMKRKPNLKFHASGIKDMGTDTGYTPLDVVGAAFSWDFDTCFRWLRGKLGLLDQNDFSNVTGPALYGHVRRVITDDGTVSDAETGVIIDAKAEADEAKEDREFPEALTHPPGLLGEVVDYVANTARRPNRTLALGAAIVVLGTLAGRRDATPTMSGTFNYVLALAPTGGGKEHPQVAGSYLLRRATEDSPGVNLVGAPSFMSESAILSQFVRKPCCASWCDEFGALLAKINHPRAGVHEMGLKGVLMTAWGKSFASYETPEWANRASITIDAPSFSIFGASTPGAFYKALQGNDRENGLLNRFLLLPTSLKAPSRNPLYDYRNVPDGLLTKVRALYDADRPTYLISNGAYEIRHSVWGPGAEALYSSFEVECENRVDDDNFVRTAEMANRLATILAVGCDRAKVMVDDFAYVEVIVDDLAWGIAVARWSAERMSSDAGALVADTQVGMDRVKIMAKLHSSPRGKCAQRKLMQDLGFSSEQMQKLVPRHGRPRHDHGRGFEAGRWWTRHSHLDCQEAQKVGAKSAIGSVGVGPGPIGR